MYKIIGADQKEYGPVSSDQIRQWISEGRLNGQSIASSEDSPEWKPLSAFPEFAYLGGAIASGVSPAEAPAPITLEEILVRDYTLDIGRCISRGWKLLTSNFGALFAPFLLLVIVAIATSGAVQMVFAAMGVNHLPYTTKEYLSPVYLIFNALVLGPVLGGLYYVYLSVIRGKPAGASEVFSGFKYFQDLFLGRLIPSLVATALMLPYTIASGHQLAPIFDQLQQNPSAMKPEEFFPKIFSAMAASAPICLICLVPITYFSVNWSFTLPLIIDKQMGFWTAMKTSWKMVHKHWFHVFGLLVLVGLINVVAFCACCIPALFTVPFTLAAYTYAYEDIFGRQNT